jgi:hypothetical protein
MSQDFLITDLTIDLVAADIIILVFVEIKFDGNPFFI